VRIEPARIVVVEGILLFAVPVLRDAFDLRIFVDTDDDIRLIRRIRRDIVERGRDIDAIDAQYRSTVRPMHLLHVAPSKRYAHLIVPEGGENAEALDVIVGRLKYLLATG
jgi:uridine kinase